MPASVLGVGDAVVRKPPSLTSGVPRLVGETDNAQAALQGRAGLRAHGGEGMTPKGLLGRSDLEETERPSKISGHLSEETKAQG